MNLQNLADRIYYFIFKEYSPSYKRRILARRNKIKQWNKFDIMQNKLIPYYKTVLSADPDYAYFPVLLDSAAKTYAETAFKEAVEAGNLDELYIMIT